MSKSEAHRVSLANLLSYSSGGIGLALRDLSSSRLGIGLGEVSRGLGLVDRVLNKTKHDGIVVQLAHTLFCSTDYRDVHADVSGYASPQRIVWAATKDGHVPDIRAVHVGGRELIIEVETQETISIAHTRDQCELFSTFAREHNGWFVMAVPLGQKIAAEIQLQIWGFPGTVWEV